MNKIIKIFLCIILTLTMIWIIWIQSVAWSDDNMIQVTEKIPWVECKKSKESKPDFLLYDCKVEKGFWWVIKAFWGIIKYFTFLAGLASVLTLVIGWIMYSMWWADEGMKTKAKDLITQSLLWLVVLLLSWSILYAVAPWVYQ